MSGRSGVKGMGVARGRCEKGKENTHLRGAFEEVVQTSGEQKREEEINERGVRSGEVVWIVPPPKLQLGRNQKRGGENTQW